MRLLKPLRNVFHMAANDNSGAGIRARKLRRAQSPPHDNTKENLHGIEVKDPFRPLEKLDAPETGSWIAKQNKRFEDFIKPAENARAAVVAFLEKAAPEGMHETMPARHGKQFFVWRKEKGQVRQALFVKDIADYGAPARPLLDPLKLDPTGKTNISGTNISPDGKTLAYRLSISGSDETTLKFMDVASGKDLDLTYPKFRSGIYWDRDSQGFHYSHKISENSKSTEVRYHKIGTPPEDDKVIYTHDRPETGAGLFRLSKDSVGKPGSFEWISRHGTEENTLLFRPLGSSDDFKEIFSHKDSSLSPLHEIRGRIYAITDFGSPNSKLVSFDPHDPSPEKWKTVLPENKEDQLTGAFVWHNKIFATYTHDTGEQLKVFSLKGEHLHDVPVPPLSSFSIGAREFKGTTFLISFNNFQESGNIYKYDLNTNELELHKKSILPIDLKDCIVERIQATSKDGTKVPMTVVRHPDTKLDGTAATILYGYGGFNISMDPGFSSSIAQWVREGGVYVQSNLRGGGEFGQDWYDGGRKKNKQNVFDDFIACAEHLIDNNYTSSKRLAIQGGSNGGLLTLATVVQRPDLFGAVISEVPVTDMFRFHIGSYYGYGWKSDYGDPEIKEDFNVAAKYSPLHNVKKGFEHPPILIKTDAHDDRVLPWHSFKMAATLLTREDKDSITLLQTRTDGGHSAGMTDAQRRQDIGYARAFLVKVLGPINQDEYKAWLEAKKPANKIKKKLRIA